MDGVIDKCMDWPENGLSGEQIDLFIDKVMEVFIDLWIGCLID